LRLRYRLNSAKGNRFHNVLIYLGRLNLVDVNNCSIFQELLLQIIPILTKMICISSVTQAQTQTFT
jgi:hypothetical protein